MLISQDKLRLEVWDGEDSKFINCLHKSDEEDCSLINFLVIQM